MHKRIIFYLADNVRDGSAGQTGTGVHSEDRMYQHVVDGGLTWNNLEADTHHSTLTPQSKIF